MATPEEIRKQIEASRKNIQSDNPQVEMTRLKLDAIIKLAEGDNDIFSQLMKDNLQDETFDYALAITFARSPLKNLEERLILKGIPEDKAKIKIDVLERFLKEFLVRRHCLNRKRVEEYIKALDTAVPRQAVQESQKPVLPLSGRIV